MTVLALNRSERSKMLIVFGSTLALIASIIACTKSRKYWLEMGDEIMISLKYQLMGMKENIMDIVRAKYNKTDFPCKTGCVAVVTGGSRGIGASVVKMLLQCDMDVIIGCRKIKNGEETIKQIRESGVTSGNAVVYELDNSSLECVKKFTNNIKENYDKVHVLINNAGIMFTPYGETCDGFEQQWVVNYLSHFLLTAMLMPLLCNAGTFQNSARIINVSSCAHLLGVINFDDINYYKSKSFPTKMAYAQSKLAQVIFTRMFQKIFEKKEFPIKIYAVHPGIVNTDLFEHTSIQKLRLFKNIFFKSPEKGATTTVYVAVNEEVENHGGSYFSNCLETAVNPIANDVVIQEKLLHLSLEQTSLTDFFQYL
ncbi:hypothetical protein PV327_004956 [Microctonus hyperodae]|uniref:Uncharacterized protein n=1 Tax=Microctonus hyperodae TaxID=165561 RepID=A0AA39KN88_MICHY|nr:hypothetical protein PV327_004956 [Microctonus hyperodae]